VNAYDYFVSSTNRFDWTRLRTVLDHIDAQRLIAAPDCGLGFLGRDLALAKLSNLVMAARAVG
jgi:5-methyltetrahydropteroyltriglutamate--homocysteine methyltransferase